MTSKEARYLISQLSFEQKQELQYRISMEGSKRHFIGQHIVNPSMMLFVSAELNGEKPKLLEEQSERRRRVIDKHQYRSWSLATGVK